MYTYKYICCSTKLCVAPSVGTMQSTDMFLEAVLAAFSFQGSLLFKTVSAPRGDCFGNLNIIDSDLNIAECLFRTTGGFLLRRVWPKQVNSRFLIGSSLSLNLSVFYLISLIVYMIAIDLQTGCNWMLTYIYVYI